MRTAERRALALLARAEGGPHRVRAGSAPSQVAEDLGYRIKTTRRLPPGCSGTNDPIHSVIIVAETAHRPRWEFTVAHELAHLNLPDDVPDALKESFCDRVAAALMMPSPAFMATGRSCGWDLPTLRALWPHCSAPALLRRVVDVAPGASVSAWRQSRRSFRVQSEAGAPPAHAADLEELVAIEALHHASGASSVSAGRISVRGWRITSQRALALALVST